MHALTHIIIISMHVVHTCNAHQIMLSCCHKHFMHKTFNMPHIRNHIMHLTLVNADEEFSLSAFPSFQQNFLFFSLPSFSLSLFASSLLFVPHCDEIKWVGVLFIGLPRQLKLQPCGLSHARHETPTWWHSQYTRLFYNFLHLVRLRQGMTMNCFL